MRALPYELSEEPRLRLGVVVLQADETLEVEFRRLLPPDVEMLISRVPSGDAVTPETLRRMGGALTGAAALLPRGLTFDASAYACTSGAAELGPERAAALMRAGAPSRGVTDPVSALVAAAGALGVRRLALLSPYMPSVSDRLRDVLAAAGVETPVFGTFDEPEEARVARIAPASILSAAETLMQGADADALFLSCTNLRTLDLIAPLERRLGVPVMSSNLVLAWHLLSLAGATPGPATPGRLFAAGAPAESPLAAPS